MADKYEMQTFSETSPGETMECKGPKEGGFYVKTTTGKYSELMWINGIIFFAVVFAFFYQPNNQSIIF